MDKNDRIDVRRIEESELYWSEIREIVERPTCYYKWELRPLYTRSGGLDQPASINSWLSSVDDYMRSLTTAGIRRSDRVYRSGDTIQPTHDTWHDKTEDRNFSISICCVTSEDVVPCCARVIPYIDTQYRLCNLSFLFFFSFFVCV